MILRRHDRKHMTISRIAMWDSLVSYYFKAYEIALNHSCDRREEPREFVSFVEASGVNVRKPHQVPVWKDIYVQSDVPGKLAFLKDLANNLWWSWNTEAESFLKEWIPHSGKKCFITQSCFLKKLIIRDFWYLKMTMILLLILKK